MRLYRFRSWRMAGVLAAVLAVVLALAAFTIVHGRHGSPGRQSRAAAPHPRPSAHPSPPTTTAPTPTPPSSATPAVPFHLLAPSIGVDAPVESVGTDAQGRMAAPSTSDRVGWYRQGPMPGAPGNAVIDGHYDWYDTPHAVFWRLGQLHIGDEITVVKADGSMIHFAVFAMDTYSYDAHPPGLFATSGSPSLALITCAGSWDGQQATYQKRLVVRAAPVVAAPTSAPPARAE
jgi:sortase (surface protein transpeptidase)